MADVLTADDVIPRGADLTEADIAALADDAVVVCLWSMRNRITRDQWTAQVREALRVRLGRREPSA